MMTKKQYTLKSCKNYVTSLMRNSQQSLTQTRTTSAPTSSLIIPRNSFSCWMLLGIVLACLLFLLLATGAKATTKRLEDHPPVVTSTDSLWISRQPAPTKDITIYVLPSLVDFLESVSVRDSSILISTSPKPLE